MDVASTYGEYSGMGNGNLGGLPQHQDLEAYRDHLSSFFDYDVLAKDEVLFAWYDAIMRDLD